MLRVLKTVQYREKSDRAGFQLSSDFGRIGSKGGGLSWDQYAGYRDVLIMIKIGGTRQGASSVGVRGGDESSMIESWMPRRGSA